LFRMGVYDWFTAQYASGLERCGRALRISEATDDTELRLLATYGLGMNHTAVGEYRIATDMFLRIVDGPDADLARRRLGLSVGSPYTSSSMLLAECLATTGDFEQALRWADLGVQAADDSDLPAAQVYAYAAKARVLAHKGALVQAVVWGERAVHLGETRRHLAWLPAAYASWGRALALTGRLAEGLSYLERGATIWESVGIVTNLSQFHTSWGEGLLLSGNIKEAKRVLEKARDLAHRASERGNKALALHLLGEAMMAEDSSNVEAAGACYAEASSLALQLGMRPLNAHCCRGLGKVYRATGNREQAREHFTTATTMYREMGMTYWLEQAVSELGSPNL
jgi:tetratricopeptide (TPR) repeat protein